MAVYNIFFNLYISFLIYVGEIFYFWRWDYKPDQNKIKSRIYYLLIAAQKRGIFFAVLKKRNKYSNLCLAVRKNKKIIFETLPSQLIYNYDPEKIDNKYTFKKRIVMLKIPIPEGKKFLTYFFAKKYVKKIGYPLVVKPIAESVFKGVTLNINNQEELIKAIKKAKKHQSTFIVEKFVPGQSYRALIVGDRVFACLRKPATVIGDGVSTIEKLIRKRNSHILRGPTNIDGWTLRQTNLSDAEEYLIKNKLTLQSKPRKNKIIILTDKINLLSGTDIIECTKLIHKRNKYKFLQIAKALKAPIVGFDVLMDNISQPWNKQNFFLIEANTIPSIDMHHQPLKGESQDVAGAIWDLLLKERII